MSLAKDVAAKVTELGVPCDGDTLQPHFPDCTRAQLLRALNNAHYSELIDEHVEEESRELGRGWALKRFVALRPRPVPGGLTAHLQSVWP
jgi:hypothetical protein